MLHREQPRDPARELQGELEDRSRAGDHHDDEHEHRLGEVARIEVLGGFRGAERGHHHHDQHYGPKAERHFDLAQQVPHARVLRAAVCHALEELGRERVHEGHAEETREEDLQAAG